MSTTQDRTRRADEAGFPSDVLESVIVEAEERYLAKVGKHGAGQNWLKDEARWHIWKACDELFQARDKAHRGYDDSALGHIADALNHMLFAQQIAQEARRAGGEGES